MKRRGTWELGYFYPLTPIGKDKERKWIPRLSLVLDAQNGKTLDHSLGLATEPVLAALWSAMVGAVEKAGYIPRLLRVSDEASETMFRALGFDVERPAEMPAFEMVRESMLTSMGDIRLNGTPF